MGGSSSVVKKESTVATEAVTPIVQQPSFAKSNCKIWVLSYTKTDDGIRVNDFFSDFSEFKQIITFDLFIRPVPDMNVKFCLSYRHVKPLSKAGKYLTQDCLEFIRDYKVVAEGAWIDVLCSAPAGISLKSMLEFMGKLYANNLVMPYWFAQKNASDNLKRAWIFQEAMLTNLVASFMKNRIEDELQMWIQGGYISHNHTNTLGYLVLQDLVQKRFSLESDDVRKFSYEELLAKMSPVDIKSQPWYLNLNMYLDAFFRNTVYDENDLIYAIFGVACETEKCLNLFTLKEAGFVMEAYYQDSHDRLKLLFPNWNEDEYIMMDTMNGPFKLIATYKDRNDNWFLQILPVKENDPFAGSDMDDQFHQTSVFNVCYTLRKLEECPHYDNPDWGRSYY